MHLFYVTHGFSSCDCSPCSVIDVNELGPIYITLCANVINDAKTFSLL